jgi:hypothetical protein
MFFMPTTYLHFLEVTIHHYRCRMYEAKTAKEFNFLSATLQQLEQSFITLYN